MVSILQVKEEDQLDQIQDFIHDFNLGTKLLLQVDMRIAVACVAFVNKEVKVLTDERRQ